MRIFTAAALAALLVASSARAAAPDPKAAAVRPTAEQAAEIKRIGGVLEALKPVHGSVVVPGTHARLQLGKDYYFLNADDARRVIIELWGNRAEEQSDVLGMILPAGQNPYEASWGAVVTYMGDGYVSDKDAKKIDYSGLLKDLREAEGGLNEERSKAGFPTISLIGWATPPSYDPARHSLVWARELQFGDAQNHGLNYDIRMLGREGVLSLNVVTDMAHLEEVKSVAGQVATTAAFDQGSRYQDYVKGDPKAAYGVAGLLAAGLGLAVAKKAGLIGLLLLFGKKFFAIILAAFAGGGAWIKARWNGLFGRRRDPSDFSGGAGGGGE